MADASWSADAMEARVLTRVVVVGAFFLAGIAVVNSLTLIAEAERSGRPYDIRVPWILEVSSVLMLLALVPFVAAIERRFPFGLETWRGALALHLAGAVAFSALHLAGMWGARVVLFGVVLGRSYGFADPAAQALFEFRKDLLPYSVIVLLLGLTRRIEEARREAIVAHHEARETGRLTLRSGGRMLMIESGSFDWAGAAGNYVEISCNGRTLLARTTLAALQLQLAAAGIQVARVHRSRLVNPLKVREVVPTADGDFVVRMADGSELRGSRRYRAAFASPEVVHTDRKSHTSI